ncbi:MAG: hypothetical protein HC923_01315 [Myxococcales bacterium]|nr:hypothetical protein [Myxococcales bacterium]
MPVPAPLSNEFLDDYPTLHEEAPPEPQTPARKAPRVPPGFIDVRL